MENHFQRICRSKCLLSSLVFLPHVGFNNAMNVLKKRMQSETNSSFSGCTERTRKLGGLCNLILLLGAGCLPAQAQDRLTVTLGARELWDSNFARSPDEDSEHYTHSTAALKFNQSLSKQNILLAVTGHDYRYAQRDDLDESFYEGQASWRSAWSSRFKTSVSWARDAYPVDRLEFQGKDVVARDDFTGQVTVGGGGNLGFTLGAREIAQTHSNDQREYLDYDDTEGFVAVTYTTANESFLSLRMREGEREYQNLASSEELLLNFEYRQLELEGFWALTRKTQLGFTLGRFDRDGQVNAGTGTQALIDFDWAMTEKLKLSLQYSHSEPAVGESSDSPSDIRGSKITLAWDPSDKWMLSMSAGYSTLKYIELGNEPARDETVTSFSPFTVTYLFSETLSVHMNSQWVDRESPLVYRDYDYALASFGVTLIF